MTNKTYFAKIHAAKAKAKAEIDDTPTLTYAVVLITILWLIFY